MGGKLAYRCQMRFPGYWVWSAPCLISTILYPEADFLPLIESLWEEQLEVFRVLLGIKPLSQSWVPSAQIRADFTARGLWTRLQNEITALLRSLTHSHEIYGPLKRVRIERACNVRGWDVDGTPALSLSLSSIMVTDQTVQTYAEALADPQELVDLFVIDQGTGMRGTIVGLTGPVSEHRKRLLAYASDKSKPFIAAAEDTELVVQVLAYHPPSYDFVARALHIGVRTRDYAELRQLW